MISVIQALKLTGSQREVFGKKYRYADTVYGKILGKIIIEILQST